MKYKVMLRTGAFGRRSKDEEVENKIMEEAENFDALVEYFGGVEKAFAVFSGIVAFHRGKTPCIDELLRNEYVIKVGN